MRCCHPSPEGYCNWVCLSVCLCVWGRISETTGWILVKLSQMIAYRRMSELTHFGNETSKVNVKVTEKVKNTFLAISSLIVGLGRQTLAQNVQKRGARALPVSLAVGGQYLTFT